MCQLKYNEKEFKDIQLYIKYLLNISKEYTRISQTRQIFAHRGLCDVVENLDELIVDYFFMDVLYDIAYPPYSHWLEDLFSFAKIDTKQNEKLKTMHLQNQQIFSEYGYLPPFCRTPDIEPGLTQIALLIHKFQDYGFSKFDYDDETLEIIKQELAKLAKQGFIEYEIKEINFQDTTDRLTVERNYLEITKCKNPYFNVPNGLYKTKIKTKKKSANTSKPASPISISKGQDKVRNLLYSNNVPFQQEYSVIINGRTHRFDFLVYKDNGLKYFIEYDGEQHFKPVKQWGGEAGLKERQARDKEKNEWCKSNGYELIRIPYTIQNEVTIQDLQPETSHYLI